MYLSYPVNQSTVWFLKKVLLGIPDVSVIVVILGVKPGIRSSIGQEENYTIVSLKKMSKG